MIIKYKSLSYNGRPFVKQHDTDGCYDVYGRINQMYVLHTNEVRTIPTGIALEIPKGYMGVITGRSGWTSKGVLVQTGIIDSGYRGEICVTIFNASGELVMIEPSHRIAQFYLLPTFNLEFQETEDLAESDRGTNGYGSTGGMEKA